MIKKIIIVAVLAVAIAGVLISKNRQKERAEKSAPEKVQVAATNAVAAADVFNNALPKLLDLGANKCMACKMMTPVLDELEKEFAGKLEVKFIDVWQNQDAAEKYEIKTIPTQIFISADGKELFRHVGFFPKEDILKKWKELGVELNQ
jgi:thioredoxin 1